MSTLIGCVETQLKVYLFAQFFHPKIMQRLERGRGLTFLLHIVTYIRRGGGIL